MELLQVEYSWKLITVLKKRVQFIIWNLFRSIFFLNFLFGLGLDNPFELFHTFFFSFGKMSTWIHVFLCWCNE